MSDVKKIATRESYGQALAELGALHENLVVLDADLAGATTTNERDQINARINEKQQQFQTEIDQINQKIYEIAVKENAIEMEVKHLDTQVTTVEKQLQAVEEAEGAGIDRATPKFRGVG